MMKSKKSHLKRKDLSYNTIKCKDRLFINDPLFPSKLRSNPGNPLKSKIQIFNKMK